jgi:hypothetical protein
MWSGLDLTRRDQLELLGTGGEADDRRPDAAIGEADDRVLRVDPGAGGDDVVLGAGTLQTQPGEHPVPGVPTRGRGHDAASPRLAGLLTANHPSG